MVGALTARARDAALGLVGVSEEQATSAIVPARASRAKGDRFI
jgi:hypothetical protein